MTTNAHVAKRWTAIMAIVFLTPAVLLFIVWSSVTFRYNEISDAQKIDTYMNYFPGWLGYNAVHIASIVFCLVAIILAARSFKQRLLQIRLLMFLTCLVAISIILFDIFQMI